MVSCLHCGRTWPDDKYGRNNLAKHKSRNTASDGTMSCIIKDNKRDEKRKAAEIIKKIDPAVAVAAVEQP